MTIFSTTVIIELMILSSVHANETYKNDSKITCYENICIPHDYDPQKMPVHSYDFSVYVNIEIIHSGNSTRSKEGLQSIDVHKMMLTYAPRIMIAWQDPRLKVDSNNKSIHLSNFIMDKIWTPRITVRSQMHNNGHSVNHGRTSNTYQFYPYWERKSIYSTSRIRHPNSRIRHPNFRI